MALAAGDHEQAERLLSAAFETTPEDSPERPRLLLDLARAVRASGRIEAAHRLLQQVASLGEVAGDADVVVDAAVAAAFPTDWRAGDRGTAALLDLAERLDVSGGRRAAILGARAMIEMRIPVSSDPEQQIAWVTRSGVAQPMADEALRMTEGRSGPDRLTALIGWRSTHRSPAFLTERLAVSSEAMDLAQRLLDHERLVDAATARCVDHLESGDRSAHRRTSAVLRWAAVEDGNPRLRWWAETTDAGSAVLDGDIDSAQRHRRAAFELGRRHQPPGWIAAEILLAAEIALASDDRGEMRGFIVATDDPMLESPIARSTVALMAALLGDHERALTEATSVQAWLDEESSYLLCLTLLARAAVVVGELGLVDELRRRLQPWGSHVAVDPSGWWCNGPVDLSLAELAIAAGDPDAARQLVDAADHCVRRLGDTRSLERLADLRARLVSSDTGTTDGVAPALAGLSARELDVLRLITRGWTNAAIGAELSYSASTIRADTVSIYRKLAVNGRPEAAAIAVANGLGDGPG